MIAIAPGLAPDERQPLSDETRQVLRDNRSAKERLRDELRRLDQGLKENLRIVDRIARDVDGSPPEERQL